MRSANLLSENAQEFDYSSSGGAFGGWEVTSGSASLRRFSNVGFYRKYVPSGLSVDQSDYGNCLVVTSTSASAVELSSELFSVNNNTIYNVYGAFSSQLDDRVAKLFIDFYDTETSSSPLTSETRYTFRNTSESLSSSTANSAYVPALSPPDAKFAKMRVVFTDFNNSGVISTDDKFVFYDPIVSSISQYETPAFAKRVYESLPDFMQEDDANITSIVKNPEQQTVPLLKFVESLTSRMSAIAETAKDFEYIRSVEGTEKKPTLVDPLNAPASYLPWLAAATGTTLTSIAAGFTPWLALENLDLDADAVSGEWEDLELLDDWAAVEDVDPDFFDTVAVFRNYIRTGFTGVNGGKKITVEEFIRTVLDTETPDSAVVVLKQRNRDTPFKCEILVDPSADPDASGSLLANFANDGMSIGTSCTKVNEVERSADADYEIDLLVNYEAGENAVGVHDFTQGFIYDLSGAGRNLLLNSTGDSKAPDLGGGVAEAHFTFGTCYYSGRDTYWTSDFSDAVNLYEDGDPTGFEVFVELGDITEAPAELVDTYYTSSIPASYLLREKRLIICGNDASTINPDRNDWALYMVSGTTLNEESSCRLLWVEGYHNMTATNYAFSEPIKLSAKSSTSPLIVRVKRDAEYNVTFYAQNSYYGNWEENSYGGGTITPTTIGAAKPIVQIGGTLSNGLWSDAEAISAEFYRALIYKGTDPIQDIVPTSGTATALVDGGEVYDHHVFDYVPSFFVNFKDLSNYDETLTGVANPDAGITLLGGLPLPAGEDAGAPLVEEPDGDVSSNPVSDDYDYSSASSGSGVTSIPLGDETTP